MTHRIGECSACGAVFKLPASFAHDQARCTKCGGVVNIAPVGAATPPPVPAKKVVQRPAPVAAAAPAPAPAPKKERTGPSMKEQILARQQAAAEAPRTAATPARATAASRPAPARAAVKAAAPSPARAAAKPAAAPARASSRASSRASARPERASDGERAEKGRSSGRASGSGRRASEEKQGAYRERVQAQHKKSTLIFGAVGVVLIAAISAGVYFLIYGTADTPPADGTTQLASTAGASTDGAGAAGAGAEAPEAAGGTPAAVDPNAPAPPAAAEGAGAGDEPAADAPADAPEAAAAATDEPAKAATAEKSPDLVDLTVIADFEKLPETSDEQWDEIRQAVADAFDLDAGASSGRARTKLEQMGKPAFPAILNAMKRIDVTTETGHRVGDLMQKTLERICNGNNYGWWYPGDANQFYLNKRVIEKWCTKWSTAKDNPAEWEKLSKQGANQEKPEEDPAADETGLDADDFDIDD